MNLSRVFPVIFKCFYPLTRLYENLNFPIECFLIRVCKQFLIKYVNLSLFNTVV